MTPEAHDFVRVFVQDHLFGVIDGSDVFLESADWSTGLAIPMTIGALVYTGIDRGNVRVAAVARSMPPDRVDLESWENVVDISVFSPTGKLAVHQLEYGQFDDPIDLPVLSLNGAGTYRLRVHVRGRDLRFDAVQHEPTEDYLIIAWPAEPGPAEIHKATDQRGSGVGRKAAFKSDGATPPEPPQVVAERELRARLKQAIISGRTLGRDAGSNTSPTPND